MITGQNSNDFDYHDDFFFFFKKVHKNSYVDIIHSIYYFMLLAKRLVCYSADTKWLYLSSAIQTILKNVFGDVSTSQINKNSLTLNLTFFIKNRQTGT